MQQLYNTLFKTKIKLRFASDAVVLVDISNRSTQYNTHEELLYIYKKQYQTDGRWQKNIIDSLCSRYVTFIYVPKCFSLSDTIRYDMSWHTVVQKSRFSL